MFAFTKLDTLTLQVTIWAHRLFKLESFILKSPKACGTYF